MISLRQVALALVLTGVSATTCLFSAAPAAADTGPSAVLTREYFPLTKRSQWAYRVRDFARNWTYRNDVKVHGDAFVKSLGRKGIQVEDRYSGGPNVVEEQEPILYFWEKGYLHRVFLTFQGGKLRPVSGSGEGQFLPETLSDGLVWSSAATAFKVGDLDGMGITNHHTVHREIEAVTVPAGRFEDCIRIDIRADHGEGSGRRGENIEFFYSDWYAPGVGLVRAQVWDDTEHTRERTRIELMNYKVYDASGDVLTKDTASRAPGAGGLDDSGSPARGTRQRRMTREQP